MFGSRKNKERSRQFGRMYFFSRKGGKRKDGYKIMSNDDNNNNYIDDYKLSNYSSKC